MKRFSIASLILMISLVINACGANGVQATPTVSAVDLQATISAAAFTSIAETQAAIPTATLTPTATITNTPAPSPTFPPQSSVVATFTLIPGPGGNSSGGDPCIYKVLPASLVGKTIKIRIDNPTKATIMLSVYLQHAEPQGQCGYRGYTLAAGQSLVINDLVEGCYSLWAWNPDPDAYFMVTNGTSCLNTSSNWTFDISTNSIDLR
jgi:hypothetical protein